MDAFALSRLQFAANISFHILFPTITIALGWVLLFFKLRYRATGQAHWMELYFAFTKVFALTFSLGVVTLSGDKLLGGPQAGIMLGKSAVIERLRSNPLARALRVDKLTISALGATLALYREPAVALREIPVLAMLSAPAHALEQRARALAEKLRAGGVSCDVSASESSVGGGAFPDAVLASFAIALPGDATILEERLRKATRPVIGRVRDGRLLLDMRSVLPGDEDSLAATVIEAGKLCAPSGEPGGA